MTTLTIRDLSHHAEMGRTEMSAVRGGTGFYFPSYNSDSFKLSANTQQLADQTQNTFNQNGVNAAFADHITSKVDPKQTSHNNSNINVFSPGLVS